MWLDSVRTWVGFLSRLPLPLPPNCVAWFHPFRSSCLFQIPRVRSPVDIESRQMPKRSIREDKLKSMCGTRSIKRIKSPEKKKKPSNTAPKAAPPKAAPPKATASKPVNIPLSDVSPEFKSQKRKGCN